MNAHVENARQVIKSNLELLEKGEIPTSYVDAGLNPMMIDEELIRLRNLYTDRYGFTLVDMTWNKLLVDEVIKDGRCLEIMAGSGLWSEALRAHGVDVICTDNLEWENKSHQQWKHHRTEIIQMDALEAIRTYGKDVEFILMSWPYMDITAYKALQTMRIVNPQARMIYIGEGMSGCTADDNFFEHMDEVYTDGIREANYKYCSFPGIYDRIYLIK